MNTNWGVLSESSNEMPFVVNTLLFHCLLSVSECCGNYTFIFLRYTLSTICELFYSKRDEFYQKKKRQFLSTLNLKIKVSIIIIF